MLIVARRVDGSLARQGVQQIDKKSNPPGRAAGGFHQQASSVPEGGRSGVRMPEFNVTCRTLGQTKATSPKAKGHPPFGVGREKNSSLSGHCVAEGDRAAWRVS
jgi:hypothetical protein